MNRDTLYAGDGLCNQQAVHTLVEEGPAAIQDLIDWGAEFDREGQELAFTREERSQPESYSARARRFNRP